MSVIAIIAVVSSFTLAMERRPACALSGVGRAALVHQPGR